MVTFNKLKETYGGKRVFLTGHTGFKGSWLLKIFSLLGAEVKGYALTPETEPSLYQIIDGDSLCHSVIADLRDRERLKEELISFEPDFIFHLAAQPLVRLSYQIPAETFEVNAIGTANLLDALRMLNKPCCAILITTDKVYYNQEKDYPYREDDRLGGYDPYSASKACAELIIDSYRNSFFNLKAYRQHQKAIAVGRAGNVIGGGDWAKDRLVPDIVRALSKQQNIVLRNPASIRPWQHVLEPLGGYLLLGARLVENPLAFSQAYNFGPDVNDALPVEEMTRLAINSWRQGEYILDDHTNHPHEAGLLQLDITKAKKQLNWMPKLNAQQAIETTMFWYKHFYTSPKSIAEFTDRQIADFLIT